MAATRGRWSPGRRDMIWINCDPQAGREMKNIHPLLVLSPREFNERTGIVIGLPMTTFCVSRHQPLCDSIRGTQRCSQLRLGSPAQIVRLARPNSETASLEASPRGCLRSRVRNSKSDHRNRRLTSEAISRARPRPDPLPTRPPPRAPARRQHAPREADADWL